MYCMRCTYYLNLRGLLKLVLVLGVLVLGQCKDARGQASNPSLDRFGLSPFIGGCRLQRWRVACQMSHVRAAEGAQSLPE